MNQVWGVVVRLRAVCCLSVCCVLSLGADRSPRPLNVGIRLNEFVGFTVSILSAQQKERHFGDFNMLTLQSQHICFLQFIYFPFFVLIVRLLSVTEEHHYLNTECSEEKGLQQRLASPVFNIFM